MFTDSSPKMNDIEFGDLSFIHLWIDVLLVTTKEK